MTNDRLLVLNRAYELVKWYLGRLSKFPRSHRYGIGQRIEQHLYAVYEGLILAQYSTAAEKVSALNRVNIELEILRMFSRLAHELTLLPHNSYEHASREIDEVGRMVGGWLKQQQRQKPASSSG